MRVRVVWSGPAKRVSTGMTTRAIDKDALHELAVIGTNNGRLAYYCPERRCYSYGHAVLRCGRSIRTVGKTVSFAGSATRSSDPCLIYVASGFFVHFVSHFIHNVC